MAFFPAPRPSLAPQAFPELTEREREILELIARGLNNLAITQRLVLSPKTVRNHVSNIFSKLQVADRAEAIVRAREAGMGGERRGAPGARGAHRPGAIRDTAPMTAGQARPDHPGGVPRSLRPGSME